MYSYLEENGAVPHLVKQHRVTSQDSMVSLKSVLNFKGQKGRKEDVRVITLFYPVLKITINTGN